MPTSYANVPYVSGATRLAFGRENNFSKLVAPSRMLGITNQGLDFPDRSNDIHQFRSFGFGPQYYTSVFGAREHSSTLSFLPTSAELFYYSMGQDDTSVSPPSGLGSVMHQMEPVEGATLPSMSLWGAMKGSPNFTRYFPGQVVGGFNSGLSEGAELTMSIDVMARGGFADLRDVPQALPAQPTSDGLTGDPVPYMFYDRNALITMMGSYVGPGLPLSGGRAFGTVRNFNLSHARGVHPIKAFTAGKIANEDTNPMAVGDTMPDDPRYPLIFVTGGAETTLSLDITPTNTHGSGALYDMLQNDGGRFAPFNLGGDILIPFKRPRRTGSGVVYDTLDFVFSDCKLQRADHPWAEDRSETTVSVNVILNKFKIVATDPLPNYGTL